MPTQTFRKGVRCSRRTWTLPDAPTPVEVNWTDAWADTRTGTIVPGYRYKIANGLDATSSFGATRTVRTAVSGESYGRRYFVPYQKDREHFAAGQFLQPAWPSSYPYPDENQLNNLALTKFIRNLKNDTRKVSSGVVIGEARETIDMIFGAAKTLRRGIDKYVKSARRVVQKHTTSRGKSNGKAKPRSPRATEKSIARRANKAVAETWLEYFFGWKPTISDIEGAMAALAELYEDLPKRKRISSGWVGGERQIEQLTWNAMFNNVYVTINRRVKTELFIRYLAGVDMQFWDQDTMAKARHLFGFSWEEFVPTIWELIPYSFLIDYFANIGDVIEAFYADTSRVTWGLRTTRKILTIEESGVHDVAAQRLAWGADYRESYALPGSYTVVASEVQRVPYNFSSAFNRVPRLFVHDPGSVWKYLNLGALGAARRGRSS